MKYVFSSQGHRKVDSAFLVIPRDGLDREFLRSQAQPLGTAVYEQSRSAQGYWYYIVKRAPLFGVALWTPSLWLRSNPF